MKVLLISFKGTFCSVIICKCLNKNALGFLSLVFMLIKSINVEKNAKNA